MLFIDREFSNTVIVTWKIGIYLMNSMIWASRFLGIKLKVAPGVFLLPINKM